MHQKRCVQSAFALRATADKWGWSNYRLQDIQSAFALRAMAVVARLRRDEARKRGVGARGLLPDVQDPLVL